MVTHAPTDTLAPNNIPTGIKYIFATLCSNPHSTNNIIGNQHANILDIISCALVAIHTAKTTRILHNIPLNIITDMSRPAFASAIPTAFAVAAGSPKTPP